MDKGMQIAWAVRILGTILAAKLGMEASDAATTAQQLVDGGLAVATGAWVLYSVIRHILEWRKKVAGTLPSAVLFLPLVLALAGGCMGGHDYQMLAANSLVRAADEGVVGVSEYHAAAVTDLDNAAAKQKEALEVSLSNYVAQVASDPNLKGKVITPAQARAALKPEFDKYAAQVASLHGERVAEAGRFAGLLEVLQFVKETAGQMLEMESMRYDTVDQLRAKARLYIQGTINKGVKP